VASANRLDLRTVWERLPRLVVYQLPIQRLHAARWRVLGRDGGGAGGDAWVRALIAGGYQPVSVRPLAIRWSLSGARMVSAERGHGAELAALRPLPYY